MPLLENKQAKARQAAQRLKKNNLMGKASGLLNGFMSHNLTNNIIGQNITPGDIAKTSMEFSPVLGDAMAVQESVNYFNNDQPGMGLLSGLGAIPVLGMAGDAVGKIAKNISNNKVKIYAGTFGKKSKKITPYGGSSEDAPNNIFGGIFGSDVKTIAESYGDSMQEIISPRHISHDDFRSAVLYGDNADNFRYEFKDIIKKHKGDDITDDEANELLDYAFGDKSAYDDIPDMGEDRINEIMGVSDLIDADWDFQGLKGELARRNGYTSVGMPDEHGESILALEGSVIK